MNLRVEKVKLKDKKVKRIYMDSFPKEERMPFLLMLIMAKMSNTEFLAFYDKDLLCGFSYLAIIDNITFIMFFAVDKDIRLKGYGSGILNKIQSIYPNNKFIISIERCDENAINIDQRIKRKEFYIKNGYIDTGYLIELSNTKQEIMIGNGKFNKEEFSQFFKKYANGTMNPIIWKK